MIGGVMVILGNLLADVLYGARRPADQVLGAARWSTPRRPPSARHAAAPDASTRST